MFYEVRQICGDVLAWEACIYTCVLFLNILLTCYLLDAGQCTKYVGEAQYVSPSRPKI